MSRPRKWRRRLGVVGLILILGLVAFVIPRLGTELPDGSDDRDPSRHGVVAVFGATGRVGSGILHAALEDPAVKRVHVVTRRLTPQIEAGQAAGRVEVTEHVDYLDYTAIRDVLAAVDVVYWAIGTSASNVDDETYTQIHVAFPRALVREWLALRGTEAPLSFHYVSGAGADTDSWMHWAREKAAAEVELTALAEGTGLRVIAYRPSAVIPRRDQAGLGHRVLGSALVPIKLAIGSVAIGEAMLEVTARGDEFPNGTVLESREMQRYGNGYRAARR